MTKEGEELLVRLENLHMLIKYNGIQSEQFPGQWQYYFDKKERNLLLDLIDKARTEVKHPTIRQQIKDRFTI